MLFSCGHDAVRKTNALVKWETVNTLPSAAAAAHGAYEMLGVLEDLDREERVHSSHN